VENKERNVFGQAAGLITFTSAEARTKFPGHHADCCCSARLTVVANGARQYRLRCPACQRLSRTSLSQHLLDHAVTAQTPVVRIAGASQPGFFCEHCGAAGVEKHHCAPQRLFCDINAWPTAQLCPACNTRWHEVMRLGAARL
jgi:hypothetical protein